MFSCLIWGRGGGYRQTLTLFYGTVYGILTTVGQWGLLNKGWFWLFLVNE